MRNLTEWIIFNVLIVSMLAVDMRSHREAHAMSIKEATKWSIIWISVALLFNVYLWWDLGSAPAKEFLAGYVIEKSLSVDNLFVMLLIFSYFRVEPKYQPRVLLWGIWGALVMRLIFVLIGAELIAKFEWILYVFGGILIISGLRMAFGEEKEIHPEHNPVIRLFKKFCPVTHESHGPRFFVKQGRLWYATPLFITVLMIEVTDLIFAVDSIPAVFAITRDPFIVYTSNAFAILGLRALFFLLSGVMGMFHYLNIGLAIVLCFVGTKMLLEHYLPIPIDISLLVIVGVLAGSVMTSLWFPKPIVEKKEDSR